MVMYYRDNLSSLFYMGCTVNVKILKDVARIKVAKGLAIGPFKADSVVTIPRWIAVCLEKNGFAKVLEDRLGEMELYRYYHRELTNPELQPVPKDFLYRFNKLLEKLREKGVKEKTKRICDMFTDLLRLRLQKILRATLKSGVDEEEAKKMCFEEELIYLAVNREVNRWLDQVLKVSGVENVEERG